MRCFFWTTSVLNVSSQRLRRGPVQASQSAEPREHRRVPPRPRPRCCTRTRALVRRVQRTSSLVRLAPFAGSLVQRLRRWFCLAGLRPVSPKLAPARPPAAPRGGSLRSGPGSVARPLRCAGRLAGLRPVSLESPPPNALPPPRGGAFVRAGLRPAARHSPPPPLSWRRCAAPGRAAAGPVPATAPAHLPAGRTSTPAEAEGEARGRPSTAQAERPDRPPVLMARATFRAWLGRRPRGCCRALPSSLPLAVQLVDGSPVATRRYWCPGPRPRAVSRRPSAAPVGVAASPFWGCILFNTNMPFSFIIYP